MNVIDDRTKLFLCKVYASQFASDGSVMEFIKKSGAIEPDKIRKKLEDLQCLGLVEFTNGQPLLTESGRKSIVVVMTGGSFDIIHPGHVETLDQARALGDVLVVSVARDKTFERNKRRPPQHGELLRRYLVSSLRSVDCAVLGSETDIFETVLLLKPDVIALGYDQHHEEAKILEEVRKRGLNVRVVRLKSSNPDIKTSAIISQDPEKLARL